jgi:hypothetical protein
MGENLSFGGCIILNLEFNFSRAFSLFDIFKSDVNKQFLVAFHVLCFRKQKEGETASKHRAMLSSPTIASGDDRIIRLLSSA